MVDTQGPDPVDQIEHVSYVHATRQDEPLASVKVTKGIGGNHGGASRVKLKKASEMRSLRSLIPLAT